MSELTCPYCNSKNCQKDYDLTWKDARFPKYSVASCSSCHVGFVLPLPTENELKSLYDSVEYHDEDRCAGNLWEMDESQLNAAINVESKFLTQFQEYIPPSGHVLDVGAGWGTLLKSFALQGYQTTGIEISEMACEFAQKKLKLDVFNLPIEKLNELPNAEYDLVTMRHVMEHFYDPKSVLQELHRRVSENGKIIITVPDYGSYDRKRYGKDWPAFGPYHLWYFTQPSLQRLLSDCGFDVIEFRIFLSDRIFHGQSGLQRGLRKVANRLGAKHFFSGRSISLIAKKSST